MINSEVMIYDSIVASYAPNITIHHFLISIINEEFGGKP